jgi:hypothetical protein
MPKYNPLALDSFFWLATVPGLGAPMVNIRVGSMLSKKDFAGLHARLIQDQPRMRNTDSRN